MKKVMMLAAIGLCLSCTSQVASSGSKTAEMDAKVAAMTPCERLQGLIQGHAKGFPLLRLQKTQAKLLDVWKARYHLVGDSCQVWVWGQGQSSYMCSLSSPNQETAMAYYEKAKQAASECLGSDWHLEEGKRKLGEGMKAQYSHANEATAVGVQAVATPGLFKDEWTTYFFVGNPNDAL